MNEARAILVMETVWGLTFDQAYTLYMHLKEGYTIPAALNMIGETNGCDCSDSCFVCDTIRSCLLATSSVD